MSWKFCVMMKVGVRKTENKGRETREVKAVLNLLQVSIIFRDTDMVKTILELLTNHDNFDGSSMFTESLTFPRDQDQEVIENLTNYCIWIKEACAIHLATFWHCESLAYLLKMKPELGNQGTKTLKIKPIHIAAALDNVSVIRLLIHCKVGYCFTEK